MQAVNATAAVWFARAVGAAAAWLEEAVDAAAIWPEEAADSVAAWPKETADFEAVWRVREVGALNGCLSRNNGERRPTALANWHSLVFNSCCTIVALFGKGDCAARSVDFGFLDGEHCAVCWFGSASVLVRL